MEIASAVFVPRSKSWWTNSRRRRSGYHYPVSKQHDACYLCSMRKLFNFSCSVFISVRMQLNLAPSRGSSPSSIFFQFDFRFQFLYSVVQSVSLFSLCCETRPSLSICTLPRPLVEAAFVFYKTYLWLRWSNTQLLHPTCSLWEVWFWCGDDRRQNPSRASSLRDKGVDRSSSMS